MQPGVQATHRGAGTLAVHMHSACIQHVCVPPTRMIDPLWSLYRYAGGPVGRLVYCNTVEESEAPPHTIVAVMLFV